MLELTHKQRIAAGILLGLLLVGGTVIWMGRNAGKGRKYRVEFKDEEMIYVHVCGAVRKPGVIKIEPGTRVFAALRKAGGSFKEADLEQVNLAAFVEDGEQIYLPRKGETVVLPESAAQSPGNVKASPAVRTGKVVKDGKFSKQSLTVAGTRETAKPKLRVSWPLDLNRATQAQLELVPGIGPVMATRILAFRQAQGRFNTYEELLDVNGIGSSKLEKFRPYLCVR
jgi:competence protein ComEA